MMKNEESQIADSKGVLDCKALPETISKSTSLPTVPDPKTKKMGSFDNLVRPKLARALSDKFASDYKNESFDDDQDYK